MPGAPEVAIVSGTIQDPSGQIFANGTWQLIFKEAPNVPGPSRNLGASGPTFIKLFGGSLDGTGAFSVGQVIRNDFIAPSGSSWTLVVVPNASSNAYQIDVFVTSAAVNVSAQINAAISNIFVQAFPVAHAYKDSEVIPVPGSGGLYYNVTNRSLRVWDGATQAWLTQTTFVVPFVPVLHNFLTGMDSGGNFSAAQPSASDLSDGLTGTGLVVRQTSPTINSPSLTSPSLDGAFFTFLSKDLSSSPAATGDIRLSNGTVVKYRNLLNSGDITAFQFGLGATDDILRITGGGPIQIPSAFSPDSGVHTLNFPAANGNVVVDSASQTLSLKTIVSPIINTGITNSGTGFKHARVSTGSIGAGLRAAVVVAWPGTAFPDTNYTEIVSVEEGSSGTTQTLVCERVSGKVVGSITVTIFNSTGGALTGTVNAIAVHD